MFGIDDLIMGGISAAGSIVNGIRNRNAAKRASTVLKNATDQGVSDLNDATNRFGDRVFAGLNDAKAGLQNATDWGTTLLNQGYSGANNTLATAMSGTGEAYSPYLSTGRTGANRLQQLMMDPSSITSMPGYQFRMDQGSQLLGQSAAARGALQSGGMLKALTQYGQGFASNEYDRAIQQALGVSGLGLNATNAYTDSNNQLAGMIARNQVGNAQDVAGLGVDTANTIGNWTIPTWRAVADQDVENAQNTTGLRVSGANAEASGILGATAAGNGMISGATNALTSLPWGDWFGKKKQG